MYRVHRNQVQVYCFPIYSTCSLRTRVHSMPSSSLVLAWRQVLKISTVFRSYWNPIVSAVARGSSIRLISASNSAGSLSIEYCFSWSTMEKFERLYVNKLTIQIRSGKFSELLRIGAIFTRVKDGIWKRLNYDETSSRILTLLLRNQQLKDLPTSNHPLNDNKHIKIREIATNKRY